MSYPVRQAQTFLPWQQNNIILAFNQILFTIMILLYQTYSIESLIKNWDDIDMYWYSLQLGYNQFEYYRCYAPITWY